MNRKRLLLAALIGLLALSLVYAFWTMPRQEKAPPRTEGPRSTARKPAAGKVVAPPSADRLHLGLLAQEPQPFPGAARDIFRFHGAGAPAVEATETTATPAVAEETPPPPPPPPPPPTPEEILRDKVAGITLLGSLDKGGVRTVFLSYAGELSLVKAGESFGKQRDLVAKEVTASELVVGSATGPETVRIKLVENEAPTLSTMSPGALSRGAQGGGVRPGGRAIPPRRGILQPRQPDPEEEAVEQEEPPPNEDVIQEEPVIEEPPSGEGNGNDQ